MFLEYYKNVTGISLVPIGESTYYEYFNHFVDFTFDSPKTDVCNDCYMYKIQGRKTEAEEHMKKVEDCETLKKELLSTAEKNYV